MREGTSGIWHHMDVSVSTSPGGLARGMSEVGCTDRADCVGRVSGISCGSNNIGAMGEAATRNDNNCIVYHDNIKNNQYILYATAGVWDKLYDCKRCVSGQRGGLVYE